jgi:NTE family protein
LPLVQLLPKPVYYVLAGGGAHGAVQWGALQALAQTDLTPDFIMGTSAGALSGSIYAEDPQSGVARLAYVWAQMDMSYLVGEKWWTKGITQVRSHGLVSNTIEEATLDSILHTKNIEELSVPFAAVATDLASGRPHVFDQGPLIPALLASSAIPGVLPPVTIDGRAFCDGLASANLPAVPAVERGAASIVVLDTGVRQATEVATTSARVLARVGGIMAASQRRRQLRDASALVPVLLLPTPSDLGGSLEFKDTMRSAAETYGGSRRFLTDLVLQEKEPLAPGLYARPDDHGLSADLAPLLKAVPAP